MNKIDQAEACKRYSAGNNRGEGFILPADDDMIATAVETAEADGWTVVLEAETTSDVVVIAKGRRLVAIGGDGMGAGAWAVDITK